MPTNKPKRTEKAKEDKTKKTASASKTTKISKTSKTSKTIKATETTKNERQKTESRRGFKHKILDDNEMEAGQKIIKEYIGGKYWSLYLDIYLLFSVSISYGIVLYLTDNSSGIVFIIFAIICCVITSIYSYRDVKKDIGLVLKDLEIMLKGG